MEHEELTKLIIGAAFKVYNTMGYGFVESVYENCMLIELRKRGLAVVNQHPITVYYDGHIVGDFKADLFVNDAVIVELKSISTLLRVHEVQVVNYLKATGINVGLLINFAEHSVELKRKSRLLPDDEGDAIGT